MDKVFVTHVSLNNEFHVVHARAISDQPTVRNMNRVALVDGKDEPQLLQLWPFGEIRRVDGPPSRFSSFSCYARW